ncbi:MAG: homoserine kinase [Longimicrobiales bacterium]
MIEVRVPCSTSNLGAGFDCIGLAFRRYLTVSYTPDSPSANALRVERSGTLEHLSIAVDDDAVVAAFRASWPGASTATGTIAMHSDIPVGRGLGSSAAATVAGIMLGHLMHMHETQHTTDVVYDVSAVTRMSALAVATDIEGHPDNAAPSLFGGLVAVARAGDGALNAFRLPLSPEIAFVFAAPDVTVSTTAARAALPVDVPHALASRMLGRAAALIRGLEHADPDLLRVGLTDELHVPYRLPLIPGGVAAIEAARDAGAWGATISGSGSGLVAVGPHALRSAIASAMSEAFASEGTAGVGIEMEPDVDGVRARRGEGGVWA